MLKIILSNYQKCPLPLMVFIGYYGLCFICLQEVHVPPNSPHTYHSVPPLAKPRGTLFRPRTPILSLNDNYLFAMFYLSSGGTS